MAATVELLSYHGYSAGNPTSSADVAGGEIRFKLADNDSTADNSNPITIPAAGTNYSWIKQLRLSVSAWNTGTSTIGNARLSSGANTIGTGVDIGYQFGATYIDPVTNAATPLASRAGSIINANVNIPTVGATIVNPTTGTWTQFTALQVEVGSTATQGTTPAQAITFTFDES